MVKMSSLSVNEMQSLLTQYRKIVKGLVSTIKFQEKTITEFGNMNEELMDKSERFVKKLNEAMNMIEAEREQNIEMLDIIERLHIENETLKLESEPET